MFLWYLRTRDTTVFQTCDRLVQGFSLPIVYDEKSGNSDATRRLQHQPNDSSQIVRSCETVGRTTAPSCCFQKAVDNVVCPMRASMIFEFATTVQSRPLSACVSWTPIWRVGPHGCGFATVKGEGGRSKPSTRCLCMRLAMQILLAVTTMCLPKARLTYYDRTRGEPACFAEGSITIGGNANDPQIRPHIVAACRSPEMTCGLRRCRSPST